MATVHLTEAELARDLHGALDKVRHGMEIIIDDDSRAVAVIRNPKAKGNVISEVFAAFKESDSPAPVEDDCRHWDPPEWA